MLEYLTGFVSAYYIAAISFVGGILSATMMAFINPLGGQFITRKFSRRPIFSVNPPVLPFSLKAEIHGLNNLTKSGRDLYGIINGVHVGIIASRSGNSESWQVDLSKSHLRRSFLQPEPVKMRFFVDPDLISEEIAIFSEVGSSAEKYKIKYVDSGHELIASISSDSWLHLVSNYIVIDECFPTEGSEITWEKVFDGFELCVRNAKSVRLQSNNSLIASSSAYGWVLCFEGCERIIIENTVFGHTKPGYCQGGVLKFNNCKFVHVLDCDLFGCGTYGIEVTGCADVKFTRTIVRDCTYGIMQINHSENIQFYDCTFERNREFDLINVSKSCKDIAFSYCRIENNYSSGVLFKLEDINAYEVRISDCILKNNDCLAHSNQPELLSEWNSN